MALSSISTPRPLDPTEQLRLGKEIIRCEGETLTSLAEKLGEDFLQAVALIGSCRGSVIVSGMGKAGLIARKITATFASTGTRSHFLHPAEAIHGDLGCMRGDDLALIFSFSGHTEEIVRILPAIAQLETPIIAVTAQPDSPLAKHAAMTLHLGSIREAGPLGLAPTASTAAMLAIGDALALVVSQARGFTEGDFARNHPGGNLGRKLSRVEEVMRGLQECRVATEDQTLRHTLVTESRPGRRSGAIIITNSDGILSGIFTDSDLARLLEANRDWALDRPLGEVMTHKPAAICTGALLVAACEILSRKKISELPVVDEQGKPVGLIDITDVVGLAPSQSEVLSPKTKTQTRLRPSHSTTQFRLHNPDE